LAKTSTLVLMTLGLVMGAESTTEQPKTQDHCYALVLGGGGTRGAYQAGAIWGMLHAADDLSKYKYDVVSGVSAGTINGAAFATYAPGEEIEAAEVLSNTW